MTDHKIAFSYTLQFVTAIFLMFLVFRFIETWRSVMVVRAVSVCTSHIVQKAGTKSPYE